MFKVGDTVLYKMDGANKNLRGKEGTITKIVDGKKTVKFKGVAKEVLVKAVNMVVLDLKKEVGGRVGGELEVFVAGECLFKKGDKVVYNFVEAPGHFGDKKYNGKFGEITKDQVAGQDYVEARFPDIDGNALEWYTYNIVLNNDHVAPIQAGARVLEPLPPPPPVPVINERVEEPPELGVAVDAYAECQALAGLNVGDTVKVLRTAKYGEGGWYTAWNAGAMNGFVGQEKKVVEICPRKGLRLEGGYWFPWFVLELVRGAAKEERFNLEGVDFVVRNGEINVGERFIFNADKLVEQLALAHAKVKGIAA